MFPRVNYAPPPNVVLDLMSALFLFGLNVDATREGKGWHVVKLEDDINRVILFCRHVLIPSLKQTEAKKNCIYSLVPEITLGVNVKLFKLVSGVLDCLSPASVKRTGKRGRYRRCAPNYFEETAWTRPQRGSPARLQARAYNAIRAHGHDQAAFLV